MISRRYLRIKVFQVLYAYFQSVDKNEKTIEKEMFLSIHRMHDLYLLLLTIGQELIHQANFKIEEAKKKKLPTAEDLNPNTKFIDNQILARLGSDAKLNQYIKDKKLYWAADQELMLKFFNFLRETPTYTEYMATRETDFEADKRFVLDLYKKVIPEFDLLISEIQDKSIFWGYDEMDFILSMVIKTIKKMEEGDTHVKLEKVYRDEEEDIAFVKSLLHETIVHDDENSELIADKTKNWDVERIAMIDILLMKMALTELLYFKSIPVKVTLNEYIELSKWYSTPKSKVFVNGVLDKLVADLKAKGTLKKIGKGLLEN
ncbi:MAG: transcription antitermination factor NusB [Flavobacteriales bacterium]|nr:transcription antitermination factor NusB [Flavobacteriales bacterium]